MRKAMLVFCLLPALAPSQGKAAKTAPAHVQAALMLKLLPYCNSLDNKTFSIHVIGDPEVAELLTSRIGTVAGKAKLGEVSISNGLPEKEVDIIFIGTGADVPLDFTGKQGVLTVTGDPALVARGVTLGIGIEGSKPKVYLNLETSRMEGMDWNPAILRIAETVQ